MSAKKRNAAPPSSPCPAPASHNMSACSFCAHTVNEAGVSFLIAGPLVTICDVCVELCVDIIAEQREKRSAAAAAAWEASG